MLYTLLVIRLQKFLWSKFQNQMGFYIHLMNHHCFVPVFMDFIQQGFQPALSTLTVSVQESDHLPSSLFGT